MFGVRGWQKFHSLKMIRVAFSATLYSANRKRKGRNLKSLFKKNKQIKKTRPWIQGTRGSRKQW